MTKRRSVGRPRQDAEPGERAQLSFRVTAELKRRLDAAADQSGRSQSQEAELRLERSFDRQDLLSEVRRLFGPISQRMSSEYDGANPILATGVEPGVSVASRSKWKGFLKLSRVSACIAIYPATSSEKVTFVPLNRSTGNGIKLQNVDAVTEEAVEREDIVKGYEVAKGQYVQVEDEELAEIAIESSHTVDIEKFVPKASIDDRYRDTPYYLAPEDQVGQEAFALIREAMKKKKMVGIARVVMASRERIMMLEPFGKGIVGTLLHYPYEICSEAAVFDEIPELKLPDQMIGLAEDIIDRMTGEFEPDKFEDRFELAMIELIRSKQAGLPAPKEKKPAPAPNVVNLMDALRRSIEDAAHSARRPTNATDAA